MNKLILLSAFTLLLISCKKEDNDFLWEKSFGKGIALFVRATPDSGIVSCGIIDNKPYLLKLSREKKIITEYKTEVKGLFSSTWYDTSCFVAAGNENGKMLLAVINKKGELRWDTTINTSFRIDISQLMYTGFGEFLAVGSARADSAIAGAAGLLFVRFDTTGRVIIKKEIADANFIAIGDAATDGHGNIFLALTRKTAYARSKASAAMFNNDFQKIWETDLYNNPDFGAASFSVLAGEDANIYLSGKTEVTREQGTIDNSFLVSLSSSGTIRWKKYLEINNSAPSLIMNKNLLMMLNRNCMIVNLAEPSNGEAAGLIRVFSACVSDNTDTFGTDLDINYDKNLLLAGSKGGNFYLALKSIPQ
jgi:hypothetical protein